MSPTQRISVNKKCPRCGDTKSAAAFYPSRSSRDGLQSRCKACQSEDRVKWWKNNHNRTLEYRRKHRAKHGERWRWEARLHKYGITKDDYNKLLAAQGGTCAICESKTGGATKGRNDSDLRVDHCHKTGMVRGLLCSRCNAAIGLLNDDANLLGRAIAYLNGAKQ